MARMASAVAVTSSPSSRPSTRLSPTASADSIRARCEMLLSPGTVMVPLRGGAFVKALDGAGIRSEEHTSELQSLMRISYAVFCLKKKKTTLQPYTTTHRSCDTHHIYFI